MSSRRTNNIKVLLKKLGFLQITEEASNKYKQTDTEILEAPAQAINNKNIQAVMLKNIVLDPGWFDSD